MSVTKYITRYLCFYRPQRSCGQGNIFTPVCHSVHRGVLPQCMLGYQPPPDHTPPIPRDHTHPQGPDPPGTRSPQDQTPTPPPGTRPPPPGTTPPPRDQTHTTWDQTPTPLGPHHPPGPDPHPREADSSIRSTSGRYASYWNAFLLFFCLGKGFFNIEECLVFLCFKR